MSSSHGRFSKFKFLIWIPELKDQQKPVFYFFSMFSSLYAFLVLLAIFLPGGISEKEEMLIYVLGWPAAVLANGLSVILLRRSKHGNLPGMDSLWDLLLFNAISFVILVTGLYFNWRLGEPNPTATLLINSAVFILPAINVLWLWWINKQPSAFPVTRMYLPFLLGIVGFIWFFDPVRNQIPLQQWAVAALGGSLMMVFNNMFLTTPRIRAINYILDFLVLLVVILACFDPALAINSDHQNFYLGPVNRILHGGTALVDTFSQYGVLVLYFIAFIFKTGAIPFTYQGFSLLVALLLMLHFCMLYLILIQLFTNRPYAILLMGLVLLLGLFGTLGLLQAYPSTGPLRFELGYLTLIAVYFRRRSSPFDPRRLFLEYCLVGIASLWSFETFVYTAFPYLGICLYESFSEPVDLRQSARRLAWRLLWFIVSLAFFQIFFALFTFILAGQWPDWGAYLGYINAYSSLGSVGTLPIYPWGFWFPIICIYTAALTSFTLRFLINGGLDRAPKQVFLFGLTLFGIAIFTYFLGRSHPNALYHISTPAVILAGYGYASIRGSDSYPRSFRNSLTFVFYSVVLLTILGVYPSFLTKLSQHHVGFDFSANLAPAIVQGRERLLLESEKEILMSGSGNPQVAEALYLIRKYTPNESRVTVFLSLTNTTEVLMGLGRIHTFPINDLLEDAISERVFRKIIDYPQPLNVNDFVFLPRDPMLYKGNSIGVQEYSKVPIYLIDRLCNEFNLKEVETSPTGVTVMKLRPHTALSSPYCETIYRLKAGISN